MVAFSWSPEIQMRYPMITEAALSPDGAWVVYAVREPLLSEDESRFITHLYRVDTAGGEPVQLTHGAHTNHTPRWSPDGRHLAFLSDRGAGEKANLYVMRRDGGEPWALTAYEETAVQDVIWAPDGQSLAFLMAEPPDAAKLRARKAKDDAFIFGEDEPRCCIYRVAFDPAPNGCAAPNGDATQLTAGAVHVVNVAWFPDGEHLALVYQPTPLAEDWTAMTLATIPADTGDGAPYDAAAMDVVATVASGASDPKVSPDGAWIACVTGEQPARWGMTNRVALYPTSGGPPRPLVETPDGQTWLVGWSADGTRVYAGNLRGFDTHIWALYIDGETATPVLATESYKSALHTAQDAIVFVEETFHRPNALRLWMAGDGVRTLAAPPLPDGWPDAPLPRAELLRWEATTPLSGGASTEIEGVVIYPQGYQAGDRCPLVVEVHGGPMSLFRRRFLGCSGRYADALSLTARGFAVLRVNPRGSSGYGRAFRFANYNDWGLGDFQDILDGVETLVARGVVDPDRLGIMGWSYGGYMTSWTITQTDRFKAACVGAGVTNLMSFTGTADIPGFIPDFFGSEFWEDLAPYQRHSALFHMWGVTTPTLIQHGEDDVRVPLGQGRELYNALKRQGVPVRMVIYPRQGHGIAEPRLRCDMQRRPVAWFERWLLDREAG